MLGHPHRSRDARAPSRSDLSLPSARRNASRSCALSRCRPAMPSSLFSLHQCSSSPPGTWAYSAAMPLHDALGVHEHLRHAAGGDVREGSGLCQEAT